VECLDYEIGSRGGGSTAIRLNDENNHYFGLDKGLR
jgi:hypothetical protein